MVPGARQGETPDETEERKWVSYLMRRRPRVLSSTERRVLTMLYATEEATRRESCAEIADRLGIENVRTVHEVAEAALKKICYEPKKLRRR